MVHETFSRQAFDAQVALLGGDTAKRLQQELIRWQGGDTCQFVRVVTSRLGKIDSQSSPCPARDLQEGPFNTETYRLAPGDEGEQAFNWKDKPHRLIYDLCAEIELLQAVLKTKEKEQNHENTL